jgi:hypothetical protein
VSGKRYLPTTGVSAVSSHSEAIFAGQQCLTGSGDVFTRLPSDAESTHNTCHPSMSHRRDADAKRHRMPVTAFYIAA